MTAKWKARSETTYHEHCTTVDAGSAVPWTTLLLGDSLFQRIATARLPRVVGSSACERLKDLQPPHVFNAGVGGDKIENLLWRLEGSELWTHPNLRSITSVCLWIGTNNLTTKPVNVAAVTALYEAVMVHIRAYFPTARVFVFEITPRTDVPAAHVDQLNTILRSLHGTTFVPVHVDVADLQDHVHVKPTVYPYIVSLLP